MALLLDDLLDVSRITRGMLELRKSAIELAATIDAAVETVRPVVDARQHTLSVTLPPKPVWINADGLRLCQVIANLLANAAKFTPVKGHLWLSAGCANGQVIIEVRDNGAGIAREDLERIFQMFVRGPRSHQLSEAGLGIGLALTKGIVELHGGTIEARSEGLGRGSEFTVRLPLGQASHIIDPDKPQPSDATVVRRRILVVDDNRDAADTLAAVLRLHGHEVLTAYDGEEGLVTYLSFRPEFAVLDIGMPKLSGHELAERIRQLPSDRKITLIAATGWGQESDRHKSSVAGFDHHLTKPINIERLTHIFRTTLHWDT